MEDLVHRRALATKARALGLLLAWLFTGACMTFSQAPELKDLESEPAAELRMPGVTEIGSLRKERAMTVDGPTMANAIGLFGTQASTDDVLAFYATELARLGWTHDRLAVNKSSTDIRVDGWCKPADPAAPRPSRSSGLTFRVAIQDPGQVSKYDREGRRYPTVFEAGLIGVDPDQERCGRG